MCIRDSNTLNQRLVDIQSAVELPFPQQLKALSHLTDQWSGDDSWKKTRFLKFYQPRTRLVGLASRSRTISGGFLSLVAIKKWQLDHDGELPPDVGTALRHAGVEQVGLDPFSGQPFKMVPGKLAVYSVGSNGIDDRAENVVTLDDFWSDSGTKSDILIE